MGDQQICPRPSSWQVGTTSFSMTRQRREYWGWLEMSLMPSSPGECGGRTDFVHGPFGNADIQGFALPDDVGEGLHGFFQRGVVVVAVGLVEVHVVGLQSRQGSVDGFHDVLAGQPAVVPALAGGEVDLGEDLEAFSPHAG